jgi:tetratricopeptide (TPR) repeat protein
VSGFFQWIIFIAITGSPLGSAVALLVFWFLVDRFTTGVLPDPWRALMRRRRETTLRRTLLVNPHDGRARLELAQLYVERGNGKAAVEVLRPTFDRGAEDIQSVFTMGAACMQAGYYEQGEKLLAHASELDEDFRVGEIELARARGRLAQKDYAGARTALEAFVRHRKGTVEGRVLLAKALDGLGDDASAALMRDEAWREYVAAPGFQRRKERLWAWRARPSRPMTYGLVAVLAFTLFFRFGAPALSSWARSLRASDVYVDPSLQDPDE